LKGSTAYVFFLAAFPGYFFYHVIKSTTLIPYIGWFSVVLALYVAIWLMQMGVSILKKSRISVTPLVSVPFWFLAVSMLFIISANLVANDLSHVTTSASISTLMVVVWMIALFQIGRNIELEPSGNFACQMGLITLVFAICAFKFFDPLSGSMVMPLLDEDNRQGANYQGMARSVICTAIVLFPFINRQWYRICLMTVTSATLYKIGSRTELALYLLTFPIFFIVHHPRLTPLIAALSVLAGSTAVLLSGIDIIPAIENYLNSDASLNERSILLEQGLSGIQQSPLLGDFLGQVRDFGDVGYYIHNALSMWQQFGVFGFSIYIYLIMISLLISYLLLVKRRVNPYTEALIGLSVISLIGVITTKSIFWPVPALAWGLAARALTNQTNFAQNNALQKD
jgi:hypothetical protein